MESKQKNKKLMFFLTVFTICIFSKTSAQITLYENLHLISETKNIIKVGKKNKFKSFVKLGQKGLVPIYKSQEKNIRLNALYFGNNNDLIFYILMTEDEIYHSKKNMIIYSNTVLMYDKKNNKTFFIEYGFDGPSILKLNENEFIVKNDFEKNISKIVMVDKKYNPVSLLSIEYLKDYHLYSVEKFYFDNNKWVKKTNTLGQPIIKFEILSYDYFLQLLCNFDESNYETKDCGNNDNFMFFKFPRRP